MRALATIFPIILATAGPAPAQTLVDLELVLAIDSSASIDAGEYALQMQGFAAAFRDEEVQDAIVAGPLGRIAVASLLWADATVPKQPGRWHVIAGPADAMAFADEMERMPRLVEGGTGIGAGVAEALRMFERNGIEGMRQVVDVSGDGVETPPREIVVEMPQARAMATARGVTVNGLAIINELPFLDRWYSRNVITGPGAFVTIAADYRDFRQAIRRKLLKEIRGLPNLALATDGELYMQP